MGNGGRFALCILLWVCVAADPLVSRGQEYFVISYSRVANGVIGYWWDEGMAIAEEKEEALKDALYSLPGVIGVKLHKAGFELRFELNESAIANARQELDSAIKAALDLEMQLRYVSRANSPFK